MATNSIEFKKEMINRALNSSISLIAKQYSLDISTIHNWIKQFKENGDNGLQPKSRIQSGVLKKLKSI